MGRCILKPSPVWRLCELPRGFMSTMASQITGNLTVFSKTCPDWQQRKHLNISSLAFVGMCVTGGFPSRNIDNAESVSMLWRHRECPISTSNVACSSFKGLSNAEENGKAQKKPRGAKRWGIVIKKRLTSKKRKVVHAKKKQYSFSAMIETSQSTNSQHCYDLVDLRFQGRFRNPVQCPKTEQVWPFKSIMITLRITPSIFRQSSRTLKTGRHP